MLVLYHAWASSCSRRVRFCLAEKGLSYEGKVVDLLRFEQHSPEYLALNPSGVVPTLVHDGRPVVESTVINEYLDEIFPQPPLRLTDPYERAAMRVWTKYVDEVCLAALLVLNWNQVMRPVAQRWSDVEMEERLALIPTAERREAWRRMARQPFSEAEVTAALDRLREAVRRMEAALAERDWLAGSTFSLADINMAPYIRRLTELDPTILDGDDHPQVARWWKRIIQRPSYHAARMDSFTGQMSGSGD